MVDPKSYFPEISVSTLLGKNEYLLVEKSISKGELLNKFRDTELTEAYFVEGSNRLIGKVKVNEVLRAGNKIEPVYPIIIKESDTISEAIKKSKQFCWKVFQ